MDSLESLEVTARTVNEAIEKALVRLGRKRDEVEISVLSEGSRGILGIGGEEARILVSVMEPLPSAVAPAQPSTSSPEHAEKVGETSRDVLLMLLSGMRIRADVEITPVPESAEDEGFVAALNVIKTEDVGILIGRRGETLSALQYLTNLITGKKVHRWSKVLVDVEGYRERRESSLRGLANRVAQRVQETRQAMALEAMPPNERRIVHLALQNHPAVATASTGEGDQRRVVISPKR